MTIYKMIIRIFSTYWKELLIYFLIFIGFVTIVNGQPEAKQDQAFSSVSLDVAMINHSDESISDAFVTYLDDLHEVSDVSNQTLVDVKNEVFSGTYDGLVIIPEDFDSRVLSGESDQVELVLNERDMVSNQLNSDVDKYLRLANNKVSTGVRDAAELEVEIAKILTETAQVEFTNEDTASNIMLSYNTGIALVGYFILQIVLGTVAMAMTEIKSEKIQDRINLSGLSTMKYNLEVVLGQVTYGILLLIITMIVLWQYIPSSVPIDYVRVGISLALFILTALSMAFLLTAITTNRNIISSVTMVISLGLAFLSGLFVPYEIMGTTIQRIAHFSPLFYFRQSIMKDIASYSDLQTEWGLMVAFAVAFLLLGMAITQQRRMAKR